jgi:hypothetical protein
MSLGRGGESVGGDAVVMLMEVRGEIEPRRNCIVALHHTVARRFCTVMFCANWFVDAD